MAFEQYFVQEWKSIPNPTTESDKPSACFDCNICLDFARDPVVTLCGHLYCWPCIYKWFDTQNASLDSDEHPQCPVCKAKISEKTMVPLYGRGQSFSETGPEAKIIPPRPSACGIKGLTELVSAEQLSSNQNRHGVPNPYTDSQGDLSPPVFNLGGTAGMALSQPAMFGEMVYARVFGNSQSLYTYPNSYQSVGPRLRRHELQADKSLGRVTIFLFCCFLFFLLLF